MNELKVEIIKLEPGDAIRFHAFSNSPENDVSKNLIAWAKPNGLLEDKNKVKVYGFDNPSPSPGSPNYGYEQWLFYDGDISGFDDVEIIHFKGGLFATTTIKGVENIGAKWKELVRWRESSMYKMCPDYCLEEYIGKSNDMADFELRLFLQIEEK